ncbi:MAG: O-antigen ligase family protein [Rubrobacteraceae bacterium]
MTEKLRPAEVGESRKRAKTRRTGRRLALFKALVLVALSALTVYGMLDSGLYREELWLPVAAGILGLLLVTLFVGGYYEDVSRGGWILVAILAVLVGIKGLSLMWTISDKLTVLELLRSSMYLATFVLVLGALSSSRQVSPLMDAAVLISAAVAGYGIMQKINPISYPATTPDATRIGSTLEYANTTAMIVGIGIVLGLARMAEMKSPLARGVYAALVVLFAMALYFTLSRGGIISLGAGLFTVFLLGGNRLQTFVNLSLISAPMAWLVYSVQDLETLFRENVTESQQLMNGASLRTDLLIAMAAAFLLQAVYAILVERYELVPGARKILGVIVLVGVLLLGGVGGYLASDQLLAGSFSDAVTGRMQENESANERLTSVSSNSRSQYWQVAWQEWKQHPFLGTGAGTFQFIWLEDRPGFGGVKQVHNVYLEQGTETGVFAFLALTGFAVLLVAYAVRSTWRSEPLGNRRIILSGLTGALVLYLFSSALEWHWYIPASTLIFFILAAIAVKLSAREDWTLEGNGEHQAYSQWNDKPDRNSL